MEVEARIRKDILLFYESMKKVNKVSLSDEERKVVELAEMYAKDSESWLNKNDVYTSFASIAYAHGLLDAVMKIKGIYDEGK